MLPLLPANFEFESEHSTPRITSKVEPILDVEVVEKIEEFVDEQVDGRFRVAELIVEEPYFLVNW